MKKFLILLCLLASSAFAQDALPPIRNDSAATTLQGTNLKNSRISTTSKGEIFITSTAGALDVDILSVVPGTGATNLGKAEDAVSASGDTGVYSLSVRSDTLASTTSNNGDYQSLKTDSIGSLWTRNSTTDASFKNQAGTYSTPTSSPVTYLTNTDALLSCVFTNATNQAIAWVDATSGGQIVMQPADTQIKLDFGAMNRHIDGNIQIYYTGVAPTSGNIDLSCMY